MTKDETLHFLGGFAMALPWRAAGRAAREARIQAIDRFGFAREWRQNAAGKDPNPTLSEHQLNEALAWGKGARAALGWLLPLPYLWGAPE